jgi:hypothetical protein
MKTFRATRLLIVAASFAVLLAAASVAEACPSCQQALAGDEAHGDLARGIYYSILFMMSMPFAIVGAFAGLVYRAVQKEKRRQAELKQAELEQADLDQPRDAAS